MALDGDVRVVRLAAGDTVLAHEMFTLLAVVFETEHAVLSDAYVDRLLGRDDFWAYAAIQHGDVVGGLTAHTLMMTRTERAEVFLYDIAVDPDRQRRGIGRRLVEALVADATSCGIESVFVPADDDDTHALDFYRALGAPGSPVTIFELLTDQA